MSEKHQTTEALLEDLQQTAESAERDLTLVPAATQASHQIAKREAQERLPKLRQAYQDRIFQNAAYFFTTGPYQKQLDFAAAASEEGITLLVDLNEAYDRIARAVTPTMGDKREFGVTQVMKMHQEVEDIFPSQSFDSPKIFELAVVRTDAELVEYVRQLCARSYGARFELQYVLNKLTEAAIASDFFAKTMAAVIVGANVQPLSTLLQARAMKFREKTVALTAESEINKSFAMNAIKDAKANARKS